MSLCKGGIKYIKYVLHVHVINRSDPIQVEIQPIAEANIIFSGDKYNLSGVQIKLIALSQNGRQIVFCGFMVCTIVFKHFNRSIYSFVQFVCSGCYFVSLFVFKFGRILMCQCVSKVLVCPHFLSYCVSVLTCYYVNVLVYYKCVSLIISIQKSS